MDKLNLLLAEDNPDHQLLLRRRLESFFPESTLKVVSNFKDYCDALEETDFDCIILDFKIEDVTAEEILCAATEGEQKIECPFIVISSSRDQAVAVASFRHGSVDFIHKSDAFKTEQLPQAIQAAVLRASANRIERRRRRRRQMQLIKQAETDNLTGLYNRHRIESLLESGQFRRDRRRHLACAMIDVDHFKEINDTYGHKSGDEVLNALGRVIYEACLTGDVPVRWGGEEFLILHNCDHLLDAMDWSEQLRLSVSSCVAREADIERAVTVSIGVHVFPTAEMSEEMIARSDQAMYLAKRAGRDRVCTWPMSAACAAAAEVGAMEEMDLEARRREMLSRCEEIIGPVQRSYLVDHSQLVHDLAVGAARTYGLDEQEVHRIGGAALLQDMGMIAVPEKLLSDPSPLTKAHRDLVSRHADFSADLAALMGVEAEIVSWIRYHHQPWSVFHGGSRAGQYVSLLAAADALAAMIRQRSYRHALKFEDAAEQLQRDCGQRYKPDAVSALLQSCSTVLADVA